MSSGDAFLFKIGHGSYWKIRSDEVDMIVATRRSAIETKLRELRDLPGVELP
jgi:hypothetical protein